MKRALVALLLAGCPSEGGVSFSYAIYVEGPTPTLVTSCSQVDVLRVRFAMGADTDGDRLLYEDEYEGRAVEDCNQQGSQLGRFETTIDRLPAGEYDAFAISLVPYADASIPSRTFDGANYAENWTFTSPSGTAVVIEEGKITNITFTEYPGGYPELRRVVQP